MATEHPIHKYSTAVDELNRARAKVEQMQEFIATVSKCLLKPYEFMVSNVGVGFPAEVSLVQGTPCLNANEWPSAKQIAEAIANLHQKYQQVETTYRALPPSDKNLVSSPPDKK